jgi:hypothetical protein
MMIFKKAIPRRTFLRGAGATIALPLLDSMVPAFAASGTAKAPVRLSTVYVPIGASMDKWTPAKEGIGYEMTPILEPLAPFRDHMLVLTGLSNEKTASIRPGENGAPHARAGSSFLTGARPAPTEGAGIMAGTSMDQIAAKELGKHTQFASLELGIDSHGLVGACESGFSCAYMNTISWRSPTTPVPVENNPRAVFERIFGDNDSTDPAVRLNRFKKDRSILDTVVESSDRLQRELGSNDRTRLIEWTDAVRDIERRIQIGEEQSSKSLPTLDRPAGIPDKYENHVKLMFDLQVLAFQTDLTRVITFMLGLEASARIYSELGITEQHHPLSHHRNDASKVAKIAQINMYHARLFSYYMEKLRTTQDGDGTLLDSMLVLYGSGLSDGNKHLRNNLPVLLAGGGAGIVGGKHIKYSDETPMSNLHLTILRKLGATIDSFGDGTGEVDLPSKA